MVGTEAQHHELAMGVAVGFSDAGNGHTHQSWESEQTWHF